MKLANILNEFQAGDSWISPDGKVYFLGEKETHKEWVLANLDKLNQKETSKIITNIQYAEQELVKLGWAKFGSLGYVVGDTIPMVKKLSNYIDRLIKQKIKKDMVYFKFPGQQQRFMFKTQDLKDYGVKSILSDIRYFNQEIEKGRMVAI